MSFYDKDGTYLKLLEWAEKFEQEDYKRVALDTVEGKNGHQLRISTVWLGLDHSFNNGGPPMIFETMVFDDDDVHEFMDREFSEDIDEERYSTITEAEAGHRLMIEKWRK